jgi:hypothetical protein
MESYDIRSILETLIIAGSVLGSMGIVAWAWVRNRTRIGSKDVAKLADSVDAMRDSVEGMRAELGDVCDRLDFTERMLAQVAEGGRMDRAELPKE